MYIWNASSIDGTAIIWSVLAIGHTICFSLDVHLAAIPDLIDNPSESVTSHLRYLQHYVTFSQQLLFYLVEIHQLIHHKQANEKRYLIKYKPGNIVMANVVVQMKFSVGQVAKLVYKSKGPFVVVEDTGFSAYMICRYGKPDSALCKFMTEDF